LKRVDDNANEVCSRNGSKLVKRVDQGGSSVDEEDVANRRTVSESRVIRIYSVIGVVKAKRSVIMGSLVYLRQETALSSNCVVGIGYVVT